MSRRPLPPPPRTGFSTAHLVAVAVLCFGAGLAVSHIFWLSAARQPREGLPETAPTNTAPAKGATLSWKAYEGPFLFAGAPRSTRKLNVLKNTAFALGYDDDRRNPAWVAYRISGKQRQDLSAYRRPSRFKVDRRTGTQVEHADFTHSGFDRGHMAPSYAIFSRFGKGAQEETFLLSNICPQTPRLNRGLWKDLELVTSVSNLGWAVTCETIWIITGPIFAPDAATLPSGVAIPSAFYKIILDIDGDPPRPRAMAFVIPNTDVQGVLEHPIGHYLKSIDHVEAMTRLDLYSDLPDEIEAALEEAPAQEVWHSLALEALAMDRHLSFLPDKKQDH